MTVAMIAMMMMMILHFSPGMGQPEQMEGALPGLAWPELGGLAAGSSRHASKNDTSVSGCPMFRENDDDNSSAENTVLREVQVS